MGKLAGGVALVVLLGSVLAGCAGSLSRGEGGPEEFRGHFTSGSGQSYFRPCNATAGDSLWWAYFEGHARQQWERLGETGVLNLPRPVFLRVHAQVSHLHPPGSFQRGTTREIYVREVIETRLTGSCDQP